MNGGLPGWTTAKLIEAKTGRSGKNPKRKGTGTLREEEKLHSGDFLSRLHSARSAAEEMRLAIAGLSKIRGKCRTVVRELGFA